MTRKMKILFTTPVLSYPFSGGPEMSVHNAIKALSRICELHVVARTNLVERCGREALDYYAEIYTNVSFTPTVNSKYLKYLGRFWPRSLVLIEAVYLIRYFDKYNLDAIWWDRHEYSFELFSCLKSRRPDIKIVCDTAAVHSDFILREADYIEDPKKKESIRTLGARYLREEKELLSLSDIFTAVSDVDKNVFSKWTKHQEKIYVFPNTVDFTFYEDEGPGTVLRGQPILVLSGSFYGENSPMEHGTRWFLSEVFPIVQSKFPEAILYVVGKNGDRILSDISIDNVVITGFVPSVVPYLKGADVGIVPLFFESGTRFKILEYGACALPTISTTLGAEGLNYSAGESILIADTSEKFAENVISVLSDKALSDSLAENIYSLVKKEYSLDVQEKCGKIILDRLSEL